MIEAFKLLANLVPIGIHLEKLTLPYKILQIGHCDLIQSLLRGSHIMCLHT